MKSLSLSESKVVSIRNTSIYQDYRFQHMSMIESQKSVEVEIDQKDFDESLDKIFIQVQN